LAPGMESWLWKNQLKQARENVPWSGMANLLPKSQRPQHHIEEQLMKNNKNINTCGNCMFAYRSDKSGIVLCGNKESGYAGQEIKKPFESGCRKWKLRRKIQPPIYVKREQNEALARYVYKVSRQ